MRLVLACRNLLHDRVNLCLVAAGVAIAITLVHVQLGLFLGFRQMTSAMIDHAGAALWVVPKGTSNFDDPAGTLGIDPTAAAAVPGVSRASPLVVGFARWQAARGDATSVILIGTTAGADRHLPWSSEVDAGTALRQPDAVVVDRTYAGDLGIARSGELVQIEESRARIAGFTHGIRSFTTSPYVFTRIDRARNALGLETGAATYLTIELEEGAAPAGVQAELARRLPSAEVLTTAEFRALNADHWLFSTGAGAALLSGAILGLAVGIAIVAQTLYGSAKDHLPQFATLRALGARSRYLVDVVLWQACASGVLGYSVALAAGAGIAAATAGTAMPVVLSWPLAGLLLALTLMICAGSSMAAVIRVLRVDPMLVLAR
ncbi:ABC transporter permease [Zavarzinia compransoris]|nr:ABC transporter permease [Zavarzinia compransoris]TDP46404.1 putative ABC transport system permease protein [Zavarzinia compransoris]